MRKKEFQCFLFFFSSTPLVPSSSSSSFSQEGSVIYSGFKIFRDCTQVMQCNVNVTLFTSVHRETFKNERERREAPEKRKYTHSRMERVYESQYEATDLEIICLVEKRICLSTLLVYS